MVKYKNKRRVSFNNKYRPKRSSACSASFAKKTILIVILIVSFVVIGGIICASFLNNEDLVKSKISSLANDYYENYFYNKLLASEKFQQIKDLDAAMEKYHTNGLSPITLNELFLYDNQKNASSRSYLTKYCDENSTFIKFYMDPPYERKSYHAEITYACNF